MQKCFSAGGKTFCLTASTQFSKSCLYFCQHFTPFQGSGMPDNLPLKFETSKLRWTIIGLGLGFITNSIINHLFPALGVTAEPNGTFSVTDSYDVHFFLLFLTGLQVLSNALKLLNVIKLQLQAGWFSPQHTEINTEGQTQWTISNSQGYPQGLNRS